MPKPKNNGSFKETVQKRLLNHTFPLFEEPKLRDHTDEERAEWLASLSRKANRKPLFKDESIPHEEHDKTLQ